MSDFSPDSSVVDRVLPSPNHDERLRGAPDMILLHYTGMETAEAAVDRLRDPEARVSSHYVVMEGGEVLQLVPEEQRAWHAGVSSWGGEASDRRDGVTRCCVFSITAVLEKWAWRAERPN